MNSDKTEIERWLYFSYSEESKLTQLEKELLIKSSYTESFDEAADVDDEWAAESPDSSADLFVTVREAAPTQNPILSTPFKDSSVPNIIIPQTTREVPTFIPKKEQELWTNKNVSTPSAAEIGIAHDVTQSFTNLDIEDKENAGVKTDLVASMSIEISTQSVPLISAPEGAEMAVETPKDGLSIDLDPRAFDDDISEDSDISFIIERMPNFKSKNPKQRPIDIHEAVTNLNDDDFVLDLELIKSKDGEIKFFEDIADIDDITYHPRHFQNHRLKKSIVCNKNELYRYRKNRTCPASADLNRPSMKYYRYSRSLKSHPELKEANEVLCRMCRGKNWIEEGSFKKHLSLCHGVFPIKGKKVPVLIDLPKSLFILKRNRFKDFHVSCPSCGKWVALGDNPVFSKNSHNRGLYYKYFLHYIRNHNYCN